MRVDDCIPGTGLVRVLLVCSDLMLTASESVWLLPTKIQGGLDVMPPAAGGGGGGGAGGSRL